MHLVGLVKSPTHVCCRYRLAAFQPLLARAGHRLELRAWPRSWLAGLWFHRGLTQADAVVVQRRLLPGWQLARVRRGARKLIFDFDDAVFLRDSYSGRGLHSERRLEAFVRTLEAADAVVANAVGVQARMVVHGETGFLADTPNEWCAAVEARLHDRLGEVSDGAFDVQVRMFDGVLVVDVVGPTQEDASAMARAAYHVALHWPIKGWSGGSITAFAHPYSAPVVDRGPVNRFTLNHQMVLEGDEPNSIFRFEVSEVGA